MFSIRSIKPYETACDVLVRMSFTTLEVLSWQVSGAPNDDDRSSSGLALAQAAGVEEPAWLDYGFGNVQVFLKRATGQADEPYEWLAAVAASDNCVQICE